MESNAYDNGVEVTMEEHPDGSVTITTKDGRVFNLDQEGNIALSLVSIKSLGIKNLGDVIEHHIADAFGSRSHVVKFSNGGTMQFAYNAQGTLLELSATNLALTMTKDNELLYGLPDPEILRKVPKPAKDKHQ